LNRVKAEEGWDEPEDLQEEGDQERDSAEEHRARNSLEDGRYTHDVHNRTDTRSALCEYG
jgi:hypothetical protein